MAREVPPTAGLPPQWQDLWPGDAELSTALATTFSLPPPQMECSGTAALVLTLHSLKQHSARRAVIIPAYTCPLVALAIAHCGLEILLCDVKPHCVDFDLSRLTALLEHPDHKDRILAVIPTHLGGRVVDVAALRRLTDPHGVFVIEDAAQALGATVNGNAVGLLGHAGFFSFAIGKGLNLFEGGALITNNPELRSQFETAHRELILFNLAMHCKRALQYIASTLFYRPFMLKLFYGSAFRRAVRANDWVSAVGDHFPRHIPLHTLSRWRQRCAAGALPRLPAFLAQTRTQGLARKQQLQQIKGVAVIDDAPGIGARGTWPVLLVLLPTQATRDAVLERLALRGLGVGKLFVHALPDYDYLRELLSSVAGEDFSHARTLAATMLCISNSPWLDDARFAEIVATIKAVMG